MWTRGPVHKWRNVCVPGSAYTEYMSQAVGSWNASTGTPYKKMLQVPISEQRGTAHTLPP